MDKKTDLASSIYFSDKAFSLNSQPRAKLHPQKRHHYKIQIVNQNLEEAIREVKANIKENPEWNLNVKAVTDQYKPKKERGNINQSIQEQPGSNLLPLSKRQPQLMPLQLSQKPDLERLKYTDRLKRQYDERIKKIKEKRMQLEVESLQKQMRAKLDKKVRENIALREKAKMIQEIQERREQKMKFLDKQHLKVKEEKSLLHQSNIAKVEMLRKCKSKAKKKQLSQSLSQYQQSKLELRFKEFLTDKQKSQRKEMLLSRYKMLRTASQGSIRRQRAQNVRQIRTSQSTKGIGEGQMIARS